MITMRGHAPNGDEELPTHPPGHYAQGTSMECSRDEAVAHVTTVLAFISIPNYESTGWTLLRKAFCARYVIHYRAIYQDRVSTMNRRSEHRARTQSKFSADSDLYLGVTK